MKIKFGVAYENRTFGAPYTKMDGIYFSDYKSAVDYSNGIDDCYPTIYVIIDDKYVYECEGESKFGYNCITWLSKTETVDDVIITYRINWSKFCEHPEKFYKYAVGIL